MEMIPHERSLVQRLEGKPFVLLGVDKDSSKAILKRVESQRNITWRSWWDGDGSITRTWQVEGFPTLYLIDHKGVIRASWVGGPEEAIIDRAVDQLVAEPHDKP